MAKIKRTKRTSGAKTSSKASTPAVAALGRIEKVTRERLGALQRTELLIRHDLSEDILPHLLRPDMRGKLDKFVACVNDEMGEGEIKPFDEGERAVVVDTIKQYCKKNNIPIHSEDVDANSNGAGPMSCDPTTNTREVCAGQENVNTHIDGIHRNGISNEDEDDTYDAKVEKWWQKEVKVDLPRSRLPLFRQPFFAKWNKSWLPVLELAPFDAVGEARDHWYHSFYAHKNNGKGCERMPHLVYWYGIERGSCDAYSLIEGKSLVSYEEGKKKGYHKLAKKIQNKLTKGKTLTKAERGLVNGLKQQEEDLAYSKAERIKWMDVAPYIDVHSFSKNNVEYVKNEPDRNEEIDPGESASDASFQDEGEENDDDEGSYTEESLPKKRKINLEETGKKKAKVAVESKLPRDNAKSNKAAAKKLSKTPEKVPEKDQFNAKLFQHRLKQNEAVFIPIMSILKSSIEKRDPEIALSGIIKLEENIATITSVFIENYLPGKFVGSIRRTFKGDEEFSIIVIKCKDIVKRLKKIYFETVSEIPPTFQPILGEGHRDCHRFVRSIRDGNGDKTYEEPVLESSDVKVLDIPSVTLPSVKREDKSINGVNLPGKTDEKNAEGSKELSIMKLNAKRSRSVSPVPSAVPGSPPSKLKSKAKVGQDSSHPAISSSNVVKKAERFFCVSKPIKTPVSKAPKKALNLRSLIDSVNSKSGILVKKEDTSAVSPRDTIVKKVTHKELPSWILAPAQRALPADEVRAFGVEFLQESLDLRLVDERIIDKKGIALELEEAVHNSCEGFPSELDHDDKYWFKLHDVAACFSGKDELGMCNSDDEDGEENENEREKPGDDDEGDESSSEDEEDVEQDEEKEEEESDARNIMEEIMAGVFSTPMELVLLSRSEFFKSFSATKKITK